jgi:hypothetical protein
MTMTLKKKIGLGLLAIGVAIQFVRPAKNDSPIGPDDLAAKYPPPPEVKHLLETACYDCHSNHTRYPWYAQLQPAGWWLASHINDGKTQLNFSEFASYTEHRRAKKLQAISDEVTDHSMPLNSYTWIHRDAKLTAAQIKTLADWAEALAEKIEPDK